MLGDSQAPVNCSSRGSEPLWPLWVWYSEAYFHRNTHTSYIIFKFKNRNSDCIHHVSVAAIKHSTSNTIERKLLWLAVQRATVHYGGEARQQRTGIVAGAGSLDLISSIESTKQEEEASRARLRALKSAPAAHFLQQGCTTQTSQTVLPTGKGLFKYLRPWRALLSQTTTVMVWVALGTTTENQAE